MFNTVSSPLHVLFQFLYIAHIRALNNHSTDYLSEKIDDLRLTEFRFFRTTALGEI
jgi:hypothetical protein